MFEETESRPPICEEVTWTGGRRAFTLWIPTDTTPTPQ